MLGGLPVGKVGLTGEEAERAVEGVGEIVLGRLQIGQGGKLTERLRQQLHLQAQSVRDFPPFQGGSGGTQDAGRLLAAELSPGFLRFF